MQVLEYVPDVEAALAEIARLTRSGGRLVNVATNWGSLWWTGGDCELTARLLSAWDGHAPHPNLPVVLPLLLERAGFSAVHQRPLPILNRHFHPDSFSYWAAHLIAAFARTNGDVSQDEISRWLDSLAAANTDKRYFFSSVPVLTTATR